MADDRARVAIIGAGGMGRFHAETLRWMAGVELVAVTDPNPEAAERAASDFELAPSSDPAATAAAGYDGVVIASPDETHAELALLAMSAGSRVLCEKPLAGDLIGAQAVVDFEVGLGRRALTLGFMREYDDAHVAMAAQLRSLGPLHYLRCTHRNTNEVARSASVVVVQSVIHDIHTVRWLTGAEIVKVDIRSVTRPGGIDHLVLVLDLSIGIAATIEFSDRDYAYEVEVEATAEGGRVSLGQPGRPVVRAGGAIHMPVGHDWFGRFAAAYRTEDRAWVASLTRAQASGPSAWDGLAAQLVAEAALAAIQSGKPEDVPSADMPTLYTANQETQ